MDSISCFFIFFLYLFIKFLKEKPIFVPVLLISVYSTSLHYYFYNFIKSGNPFYPFKIKILNINLFKGKIDYKKEISNFAYGSTVNPIVIAKCWLEFPYRSQKYYVHDNVSAGFGHLFVSFSFISFILTFFISLKNKNFKILKIYLFIFLFLLTLPYRFWPRITISIAFISFAFFIYLWDIYTQKGLEPLIFLFSTLSLLEGLNKRIYPYPFSNLFSYKENTFSVTMHKKSIYSFSHLSFYLEENDTLCIYYKDWVKKKNFDYIIVLSGGLLRRSFEIKYDFVNDQRYKNYKKIISSIYDTFPGYEPVYSDENCILWVKE